MADGIPDFWPAHVPGAEVADPDDLARARALARLNEMFQPPPEQSLADDLRMSMRGRPSLLADYVTDPALAGLRSLLPGGESYEEERQHIRNDRDAQYPGIYSVETEGRKRAIAQLALDNMQEGLGNMAAPITFHGTPHPGFPKFDNKFIGTGEGNQSYGYGFYSTMEPVNAEGYRVGNIPKPPPAIGGQPLDLRANPEHLAAWLTDQYGSPLAAQAMLRRRWVQALEGPLDAEAIKLLQSGNFRRLDPPATTGSFIKVHVPDLALDLDKPLGDQPEIQRVIASSPELRNFGVTENPKNTGADVYSDISDYFGLRDRLASNVLRRGGIPGLHYRGKSTGDRNYVTFSGDDMDILGRYDSMKDWLRQSGLSSPLEWDPLTRK